MPGRTAGRREFPVRVGLHIKNIIARLGVKDAGAIRRRDRRRPRSCPAAPAAAPAAAVAGLAEDDVGMRGGTVMGDFQLAGDGGAFDRVKRFLDPLIGPFLLFRFGGFFGVGNDGLRRVAGVEIKDTTGRGFFGRCGPPAVPPPLKWPPPM